MTIKDKTLNSIKNISKIIVNTKNVQFLARMHPTSHARKKKVKKKKSFLFLVKILWSLESLTM